MCKFTDLRFSKTKNFKIPEERTVIRRALDYENYELLDTVKRLNLSLMKNTKKWK